LVKHINRITKDGQPSQGTSAEDEWSHITGVGSKIEIQDAADVTDRSIFFSNKPQILTKHEEVLQKSKDFHDQILDTNQYQKFVNATLSQKMANVKTLLEKEKKFADELNYFREAPKNKVELEKLNPKHITESDIKALISNLETNYNQLNEKLEHEQMVVEKTKNEMLTTKRQIISLKEEMEFVIKKQQSPEITDPTLLIKKELKRLGINDEHSDRICKLIKSQEK
jgi:prolyl oligopeptidase PreP (S9A serine peptidase family)